MAIYEYKCPSCGVFEQQHPMISAPKTVTCLGCQGEARKLISAIGLSRSNSARMNLIDSTQASAYEPQVVSCTRPSGATASGKYTHNPLHAKLPRP